jgi:hypothetical protein
MLALGYSLRSTAKTYVVRDYAREITWVLFLS